MTTIGATFTRGRVAAATTEAGTPERVAGQFTALTSCAIRNASVADRVQMPAPDSATTFAVILYLDPDNANGGAGQPASGYVLDWRLFADERITVYYDKSNSRWAMEHRHSATTQTVTLSDTFSAGDAIALYVAADATTLYMAVDGGTIGAGTARTQTPTGLPATMDIGSVAAATQMEAAYGAVAVFDGPLSQTQWDVLSGLRNVRPPVFGEASSGMTGLWYGAQPVAWTISGATIDLNDSRGGERYLLAPLTGVNVGPSLHRFVDTPIRDGSVYVDTRGQRRSVFGSLALVSSTTYQHLLDLRRELAAALNPRLGEGVLMYAPGTTIYEITALLTDAGLTETEVSPFAVDVAITFTCSGGDWRSAVRTDDSGDVPFGGWAFPWAFPWTFTDSAVDITCANDGDVPVYPQIVVTAGAAGCTAPSLENETTGHTFGMRSTFEMAAGDELVIDMNARTVELEGVSAMGDRDPDTEMWSLAPGTNTVVARVSSGSASVEVRHAPLYVGV